MRTIKIIEVDKAQITSTMLPVGALVTGVEMGLTYTNKIKVSILTDPATTVFERFDFVPIPADAPMTEEFIYHHQLAGVAGIDMIHLFYTNKMVPPPSIEVVNEIAGVEEAIPSVTPTP